MKHLLLALLFLIPCSSFAQHFTQVGRVASFQWAPERYESRFTYDIFYYIPQRIQNQSHLGALIFNHGGGASTMDRAGSIAAVNLYLDGLVKIADDLGIIVVLPSANGLNWGGHTRGILKDLAKLMRKELPVDPDLIGVSGHSMGGMGIVRNYQWGADEFAFYLPMAAGLDVSKQTEQNLNKVFNIPYVHLQGLKDTFDIFVTRTQQQAKRVKALEVKYGVTSKFKAIFYDGGHNYDYALFRDTLSDLFQKPRNLYQRELWGTLHTVKTKLTENGITFDFDSEARYFWIELLATFSGTSEVTNFHAKIIGNDIAIEMPVMPKLSRVLRVYLDSRMLDLNQKIVISINGVEVARRAATPGRLRNMDASDQGFNFSDYLNIKLPI